jgi:hypothetical protein
MAKKVKILIILVALLVFGYFVLNARPVEQKKVTPSQTKTVAQNSNYFSYKGEEGKDALTLLKLHTAIEQNKSGLVTAINHQAADDKKREFWAFYVNGKMAEVGPASYKTKDADMIEWKIEKY